MANMHKIGKTATNVKTIDRKTTIRYHSTDVVMFDDKSIILNSGGWHTNTTKARMNQASNVFDLGYQVFQKKFDWFVSFRGKTLDFQSGMILKRN